MKDVICIISFGNREHAAKLDTLLNLNGLSVETAVIKKCVHLSDISEYFISSSNDVTGVEKGYLKDGRVDQAAILSVQRNSMEKIEQKFSDFPAFFIEDDPCPENFYLRKILFRKRIPFFSFSDISNDGKLTLLKGSFDIGFNHNNMEEIDVADTFFKVPSFPEFNGHIAIEPPPDTIPLRYLLHFRSPQFLVRNVIKTMNAYHQSKRHPQILIQTPVRPYNSYSTSMRAFQIEKFLGKRAGTFKDTSELPAGTTVITWSTRRFLSLLSGGFRPLPATKCIASSIYPARKKNPAELIMFNPDHEDLKRLIGFINFSGVENIPEMMYKLKRCLNKR